MEEICPHIKKKSDGEKVELENGIEKESRLGEEERKDTEVERKEEEAKS